MKLIFILLAIVFLGFASSRQTVNVTTPNTAPDSVYICKGKSAFGFHTTPSCSVLQKCIDSIIKVSRADAINKYHKAPCPLCN